VSRSRIRERQVNRAYRPSRSGIGREFPAEGMLDSFTQHKNVKVIRNTPRPAVN
jgi:hypothetical protein